jgi:hypothetical protein
VFGIPSERVVLFHNGFRIDNYSGRVILSERCIVHVIDRRAVGHPQISLTFRPLWNAPACTVVLPPDTRVRDLVSDHLGPRYDLSEERFFLVYVGKVLNRSNELREEHVADGSEVLLIMHKKYELGDRVAFERDSSHHLQSSIDTKRVGMPGTYKTSIHSLKKKAQQMGSQQMGSQQEGQQSVGSNKPAPPQLLMSLQQKKSQAESLAPGPLETSVMMMHPDSEKRESERAGAGASSEGLAAPSAKLESMASEGSKGSMEATAQPKIVIKYSGDL